MSGEAYNGAHVIMLDELIGGHQSLPDLERMRDDLNQVPECGPLAAELTAIISFARVERARIAQRQKRADDLFACLHDFAWWQSADGTEDRFRETLAQWKAER